MDPNQFKARGQHGDHNCRELNRPSPHDQDDAAFLRKLHDLDKQIAAVQQNVDHLAQRWRLPRDKAITSEDSDDADAEDEPSDDDQDSLAAEFDAGSPSRDRDFEDQDDRGQLNHGHVQYDNIVDDSDERADSPSIHSAYKDSGDHPEDTDDADEESGEETQWETDDS